MKKNITQQMLDNAIPGISFATGICRLIDGYIKEFGPRDTSVRWVAVKDGVGQWACYFSTETTSSPDFIATHGRKMFSREIPEIITADDNILNKYRK